MTRPGSESGPAPFLPAAREALQWKIRGLRVRHPTPATPTRTNLPELIKYVTIVELGYFSKPFWAAAGMLC